METYTVGVGDPEGSGEDRVDFATLEQIAERANGRFFGAADMEGLETIYARIDELVPQELKTVSFRPRQTLVHWPAGTVVVLGVLVYVLLLVFYRRPAAGG